MPSHDRNQKKFILPIPKCPPGGEPLRDEDVSAVAELAYVWGWALVNVANRTKLAQHFANGKPLLVEGMPIGYGSFTMQTEFSSPNERIICCPTHDGLYGGGAFDLGTTGVVFQVPEFPAGQQWLYSLYDARTDQYGSYRQGTEKGFYLIVPQNWNPANNPDPSVFDDNHRMTCDTNRTFNVARIFMKNPPTSDQIPDWLKYVNFYPAQNYNRQWQPGPWGNVEDLSCPLPPLPHEMKYVRPWTFLEDLSAVLQTVPAQDDYEKDLYYSFTKLIDLARADGLVRRECRRMFREIELTTIQGYMQWKTNGPVAGNGWYTSIDSAEWKTHEYTYRTATAKSNLFQNRPVDTRYYFTDTDTNSRPLDGGTTYSITFYDGLPPAQGPSSVTVYSQSHFLYEDPFSVSLNGLAGNPITIYAGPEPPLPDCQWMRTPPNEPFSLYLRAYWMPDLFRPWVPPKIAKY